MAIVFGGYGRMLRKQPHNRRAVDVNGAIKTEGYLGVQNKGIMPLIAQ